MIAFPRLSLLATTALSASLCAWPVLAAGPDGGSVAAGDATINRPNDQTTTINQFSQRAIVDWRQFHVSEDHTVNFVQPGADAVILNRINGGEPSRIMGTLNANGTVMLVNPDGILFGPNSRIDVGGLVATTHDIANDDFMAGRYRFNQPGNPSASIVNEGLITARDGGVAALVAPGVRNSGIISARLGQVGLASANEFTLDLFGDSLIKLKIDDAIIDQVLDVATGQPMNALVDNQGTLSAHGGQVALTAVTARRVVDHVINNDGIIEADTVGMKGGKIVLGAQTAATKTPQAPVQKVRVSGELRARGQQSGQTGGDVHIVGEMIGLSRATIDVSGAAGGGLALIGGDIQGGKASAATLERYGLTLQEQGIPTADTVSVDRDSVIDASAIDDGDGGQVIAWADDTMDFQGTIAAKGGRVRGDGGFAEVSGWQRLMFENIKADLTAPNGKNGTILFDPASLIINSSEAAAIADILNQGIGVESKAKRITINANIIKTKGPDTILGFVAEDGIHINDDVAIGSKEGRLLIAFTPDNDVRISGGEFARLESGVWNTTLSAGFGADWELATGILQYAIRRAQIDRSSTSFMVRDVIDEMLALNLVTQEQYDEYKGSNFTYATSARLYANGGAFGSQQGANDLKVTIDKTVYVASENLVTGVKTYGESYVMGVGYGADSFVYDPSVFSTSIAPVSAQPADPTSTPLPATPPISLDDPASVRDTLVDLIERQLNSDANPFEGSVAVASNEPVYPKEDRFLKTSINELIANGEDSESILLSQQSKARADIDSFNWLATVVNFSGLLKEILSREIPEAISRIVKFLGEQANQPSEPPTQRGIGLTTDPNDPFYNTCASSAFCRKYVPDVYSRN